MLAVEDIDLYYGASHILRGVSVTAEPGEITCVLGRNGVGKTSLLRAHHRAAADPRAARSSGKATTSPRCRRTSARAAASRWCRRAARSSRA